MFLMIIKNYDWFYFCSSLPPHKGKNKREKIHLFFKTYVCSISKSELFLFIAVLFTPDCY